MFGDAVRVDYYDAAAPQRPEIVDELLSTVEAKVPYYPLVFANGELAIAGSAEFYHVLRAVQQAMEPAVDQD